MFALEIAAQWHRLAGMQGDPEQERSDGSGWWGCLRWVLWGLLSLIVLLLLAVFALFLYCSNTHDTGFGRGW